MKFYRVLYATMLAVLLSLPMTSQVFAKTLTVGLAGQTFKRNVEN